LRAQRRQRAQRKAKEGKGRDEAGERVVLEVLRAQRRQRAQRKAKEEKGRDEVGSGYRAGFCRRHREFDA
jgi:hypothetical protein